jgi:hypothetical protein
MTLVVIPVVVVTVIIVVPMTLIVLPAVVIVVVVRMSPICARVGRSAPYSGDPHVSAAVRVPISIDPGIARTRHGRPHLIAQRGWSSAYIYAYSSEGWSRECRSQNRSCDPFRFHIFLLTTTFHTVRTQLRARGFAHIPDAAVPSQATPIGNGTHGHTPTTHARL